MGANSKGALKEGSSDTVRNPFKSGDAGTIAKRGLLALLTSGTSEIQTGGGEYGDETLADSIFPKTVNNLLLDEREGARRGKDAADKALIESQATAAALAPDAADKAIERSRKAGALRLLQGRSRSNSFLMGY